MTLFELPELDEKCGRYFKYRDLVECGSTWTSGKIGNIPTQLATYRALQQLSMKILDPVIEKFGQVELTYGVATKELTSKIRKGIAPSLDQHASHELSGKGKIICNRGGAACDFKISGIKSTFVAKWIAQNTDFDRLYFYGGERPIHVSVSENPTRKCVVVDRLLDGKVHPTTFSRDRFLEVDL